MARVSAAEKAEALLQRLLPPEQFERYRAHLPIEVVGSAGGRYELYRRRSFNIIKTDGSGLECCAVPQDSHDLHLADILAAQWLALRTNESGLLRVANTTPRDWRGREYGYAHAFDHYREYARDRNNTPNAVIADLPEHLRRYILEVITQDAARWVDGTIERIDRYREYDMDSLSIIVHFRDGRSRGFRFSMAEIACARGIVDARNPRGI